MALPNCFAGRAELQETTDAKGECNVISSEHSRFAKVAVLITFMFEIVIRIVSIYLLKARRL